MAKARKMQSEEKKKKKRFLCISNSKFKVSKPCSGFVSFPNRAGHGHCPS